MSLDSETLFNRYAGFVASFLHRMGAPGGEIEDLVQEVFLSAHRKGGYREGAASPTTFLARLALEANHARRRRQRRLLTTHSEDAARATVGAGPAGPDEALAAERATARLRHALETMDPDHRAVFVLFELNDEPCASIAAGLDIKVGTVYSRLHAARKAFLHAMTTEESTRMESQKTAGQETA